MKQNKGILYSNGVSESLSKNFLTQEVYYSLSKSKTLDEFFDILSQTSFEVGDRAFFHKECDENIRQIVSFVKNESPNEEFKSFFVLPYDFQNIANFCKCSLQNLDFTKYCEAEGNYSFSQIKDYISNKDYKSFHNKIIENCLQSFDALTGGSFSASELDFVFKKYLFDNLFLLSKKNKMLRTLVDYLISIENISVATRARSEFELESQILEGGLFNKTQIHDFFTGNKLDVSQFDEIIVPFIEFAQSKTKSKVDYMNFEKNKNAICEKYFYLKKSQVESIAPFAYFCYKRLNEIKNVRLIYSFISNNLNGEIKERLLGD